MGEAVVMMVKTIDEIGKIKYEEFKKAEDTIQKLVDTITKSKFALFMQSNAKGQSSKSESKDLKLHIRLFSQLYILTHPLDETHLDAVRGLMQLRGFTPVHQQVELVGAMRLRSTRTNRSAYYLCQGLDSKLKNLD